MLLLSRYYHAPVPFLCSLQSNDSRIPSLVDQLSHHFTCLPQEKLYSKNISVPLYLHPREPIPQQQTLYIGYEFLAVSVLGFSTETMSHALRFTLSGVFNRYPDIKFILGHCGEGLPFYIARIKQRMRHMSAGSWAMKYDLRIGRRISGLRRVE